MHIKCTHSICAEMLCHRRMYQTCKETMCAKENEEYDKCWEVEGSMALTRSAIGEAYQLKLTLGTMCQAQKGCTGTLKLNIVLTLGS